MKSRDNKHRTEDRHKGSAAEAKKITPKIDELHKQKLEERIRKFAGSVGGLDPQKKISLKGVTSRSGSDSASNSGARASSSKRESGKKGASESSKAKPTSSQRDKNSRSPKRTQSREESSKKPASGSEKRRNASSTSVGAKSTSVKPASASLSRTSSRSQTSMSGGRNKDAKGKFLHGRVLCNEPVLCTGNQQLLELLTDAL